LFKSTSKLQSPFESIIKGLFNVSDPLLSFYEQQISVIKAFGFFFCRNFSDLEFFKDF